MIVAVAGLVATGTFLVTSRSLSRIVLGFGLLGHAAVVALLASGGRAGSPPIVDGEPAPDMVDPLPQALSLTAIVISFGLTLFLLALSRRQQVLTGDDLVEDDVEDRRIATTREQQQRAHDETQELEALREASEDPA
jgi:multicomponent Na+:H+ antiporter subunit C